MHHLTADCRMGIPAAVMDAIQTALRSRLGLHAREATTRLLIHARQSVVSSSARLSASLLCQ